MINDRGKCYIETQNRVQVLRGQNQNCKFFNERNSNSKMAILFALGTISKVSVAKKYNDIPESNAPYSFPVALIALLSKQGWYYPET